MSRKKKRAPILPEATGPGAGTLLVVATPIGNLSDLTGRAAEALARADLVAAEDTRRTRILLTHLGLNPPLVSYRSHNLRRQGPQLVRQMTEGKTIALVTDAGTPCISDPGFLLVRQAIDAGVKVEAIPGVSALVTALSVSGFPADRFVFEGFLPIKGGRKQRRIEELALEDRTVALYESPHRIVATLALLAAVCPDRAVVVGRELTKLHEEIIRGSAAEVAERVAAGTPRGEYTVVIAARDPRAERRADCVED